MERLWERIRKDWRGMTLIELVCGIAIMGILTTTVGGVIVVVVNGYQRGTTETRLQQETQMAVNQIGSLLVEATSEVKYFYQDGGSWMEAGSEGEVPASAADTDRMLRISNTDSVYEVVYQVDAKNITVSQAVAGGTTTANQLLAENVSSFSADVSAFKTSGNVQFSLAVESNGRTVRTSYGMTARNGEAWRKLYLNFHK